MADLIAAFNSRWYALENVSIVLQCSDHGKREVMWSRTYRPSAVKEVLRLGMAET
jgi:hypothetical protein